MRRPKRAPTGQGDAPEVAAVRRAIEKWRNHFPDLDARAEELADEFRLAGGDLYGTISERLRARHQLGIRILPSDVMPDRLRWLDWHARQLMLNELLRPASRTFSGARRRWRRSRRRPRSTRCVAGAEFAETAAATTVRAAPDPIFRRGADDAVQPLPARAAMRRAMICCCSSARFGAGYEQVAHRLTTLQRVGARGLLFFMLRIDRAGQGSKRYAGASQSSLVDGDARCPLWGVHEAFSPPRRGRRRSGRTRGRIALVHASRARSPRPARQAAVHPRGLRRRASGVDAKVAAPLMAARGIDLMRSPATPIGLGCRRCTRTGCVQRSMPPLGRPLRFQRRRTRRERVRFRGRLIASVVRAVHSAPGTIAMVDIRAIDGAVAGRGTAGMSRQADCRNQTLFFGNGGRAAADRLALGPATVAARQSRRQPVLFRALPRVRCNITSKSTGSGNGAVRDITMPSGTSDGSISKPMTPRSIFFLWRSGASACSPL